jgi:hypothetical protein
MIALYNIIQLDAQSTESVPSIASRQPGYVAGLIKGMTRHAT